MSPPSQLFICCHHVTARIAFLLFTVKGAWILGLTRFLATAQTTGTAFCSSRHEKDSGSEKSKSLFICVSLKIHKFLEQNYLQVWNELWSFQELVSWVLAKARMTKKKSKASHFCSVLTQSSQWSWRSYRPVMRHSTGTLATTLVQREARSSLPMWVL